MRNKFSRWLVLLFAVLAANTAQAYDINSSDIRFSGSYDATNGTYDITIPIYDDGGYDEGLHRSSRIEIVYNGKTQKLCNMYSFPSPGDPQPDGSSYWVKISGTICDELVRLEATGNSGAQNVVLDNGDSWTTVRSNKSGSKTSVTLRFFLSAEVLQTSATFQVNLDIDKNNAADYNVSSNSTTINALRFPEPTISGPNTGDAGYQNVNVSVSNYDGEAYLYATDHPKDAAGSSREFSYLVGDNTQQKTVSVDYTFKHDRTVTKSKTVTIDQYPRVVSLTAEDAGNGATLLDWTIPAADANGNIIEAGNFQLEKRVETSPNVWSEWSTVRTLGNDERSYLDAETQLTPLNIEYRISRTQPWTGYNPASATINKTDMTHAKVTEFTNARLLSQRQVELTWKWDYDKDNDKKIVLTDGSKFILTREVSENGETFITDVTEELDCEDFVDMENGTCTYLTTITQSCVLYRWKIHLEPGKPGDYYGAGTDIYTANYQMPMKDENGEVMEDEYGNVQYEDNTDGINDAEVASLEYFRASHGYYGDRVELDWKLEDNSGSLDIFSVQRRVYGEEDTELNPFVQIGTVEASEGIIYYSFTDEKAVPGTTYEYMVEGNKECANEEVKTHDYTYGFSTATGNIYGRITYDSESGQAVYGAEVRLETTANIIGQSYAFNNDYFLQVDNAAFSDETVDSLSLQLFVKFNGTPSSKMSLLKKEGMYEVYAENGRLYFDAGGQVLEAGRTVDELTATNSFIQLTAVLSQDSLLIYTDTTLLAGTPRTVGTLPASGAAFTMGEHLQGYLDEVRKNHRK